MRHLRSISIFALLLGFLVPLVASAQPTSIPKSIPAVAFTKQDRTRLWIKRYDSAAYVALQADPNTNNHNTFNVIDSLAVLDQTEDGKTLLLGGSFMFYSPWGENTTISWAGIIAVPTDSLNDPDLLSHVKFLMRAPFGRTFFRPLGRVTADGHWFGLMVSVVKDIYVNHLFTLFRGSLDKSFNSGPATADPGFQIDSATPSTFTNSPHDWHCTNLAVEPDGKRCVVVVDEQINVDEAPTFAMRIYDWDFTVPTPTLWENNVPNYKNYIKGNTSGPDTMFGFTARMLSNGSTAEIGLFPSGSSTLTFHSFDAYHYQTMNPGETIARPTVDSEWYFAGRNFGSATPNSYHEDNTNGVVHGNAGDVYIGHDGTSFAYISHPKDDRVELAQRNKYSSIYVGTVGGTIQKFYNDSLAQELQPVLVKVNGYEMHYPRLTGSPTNAQNFGTLDSGKSSTSSRTITLSSTEAIATSVQIDSIVLVGGTNFSLTGGTKTQTTLTAPNTLALNVSFKPIEATAGLKSDTIKVYWNDSVQKVMTFVVMGTENIPPPEPPKSVRQEDPAVFAMGVQPNPFVASARISLTAPDAGSISIVVHDALGREVYASQSVKTAAGQPCEFTFDAKSLGLPTGTYYVTALLGDRAATREVVFVK